MQTLGDLLDRRLDVVTIPRPGWLAALADAGVPPLLAAELVELHDAESSGILRPRGDRREGCPTELAATLRHVVRRNPRPGRHDRVDGRRRPRPARVHGARHRREQRTRLPILYAATAPGLDGGVCVGPDGRFQRTGHPTLVRTSARSRDAALAARLWERSELLTGVHHAVAPRSRTR